MDFLRQIVIVTGDTIKPIAIDIELTTPLMKQKRKEKENNMNINTMLFTFFRNDEKISYQQSIDPHEIC